MSNPLAAVSSPGQPTGESASESAAQRPSQGARVLVVDDEEGVRLTLEAILGGHGYDVVTAESEAAARALLAERAFDLVLSDLHLGDGDGISVLAAARERDPQTVTIVVTGYATLDAAVRALRGGVDDFLVKPTDVEELLATFERALERRQLVQRAASLARQVAALRVDVEEHAREEARQRRQADREARLHAVAAALTGTLTPEEVARVVVQAVISALDARQVAVLVLVDDGATFEVLHQAGYGGDSAAAQQVMQAWRRFPAAAPTPVGDALRSGELVILEDNAARAVRYPHLVDVRAAIEEGATAALPLIADGQRLGAMHVSFGERRTFTDDDRAFLRTMAHHCAQALLRAHLYEAERAARAQAQAALQARESFFAAAAHELKTPITSLQGFAQLELRRAHRTGTVDPQRTLRAIEMIERQSRRLGRLVVQLLDAAQLDAAHASGGTVAPPPLDLADVDLARLVREVAEATQASTQHHRILVDAPPQLIARVDPVRIEQVLNNLLDNAVKYSPEGGDVEVQLATVPAEDRGASAGEAGADAVRLAVGDHGIGIPEEHRPYIFQWRYRAPADRPGEAEGNPGRPYPGMGLGLAISLRLVELHGGAIAAEFPPDGGTRFVVTLPGATLPGGAPSR